MSEKFVFLEEGAEYLDGPLAGRLIRKDDGACFAYDCQLVVPDRLWHWTLVPIEGPMVAVVEAFEAARRSKATRWISVVEDRRTKGAVVCHLTEIDSNKFPVVHASIRGRSGRGIDVIRDAT
jgi:hypothetical protein